MFSAVGYTAANLALRDLSGRQSGAGWDVWVSGMKAVPTFLTALILVMRRRSTAESIHPSGKLLAGLIVAAFAMQFGGNLAFQTALRHIGLAVSVPLVFAFIITTGAIFGRMFLGDRVTPRTLLSIAIMMIAIILLSWAASLAAGDSTTTEEATTRVAWLGIMVAVISGTSYGVNSVIIRRMGQKSIAMESVLLVFSGVGVLTLICPGWQMMGSSRIAAITAHEWHMMFWAGTFNAFAFFSLTYALKLANITLVNVVNASQNAMCAVAAVIVFSEPVTLPLVVGVLLSMIGLAALDRK